MKILAIETSCDDTGIAVLEVKGFFKRRFNVPSNIVSSQPIHQNYGGVFPMMAKREHQNNLVPVLMQALTEAKLANPKSETRNPKQIPNSKLEILKKIFEKENTLFESAKQFFETYEKPDVDYIAVTHGPGLEPCLWVGVNFAKALSFVWEIPVVPVNHIEAHILVNFLDSGFKIQDSGFPVISLVVSGGHTQLILMKSIGSYEIIGETRDDAAGECFDKCAKILGLGYPGGPIISKIAADYTLDARPYTLKLPRPMMHTKDYNFSFSGLKTAVLYKVRDLSSKLQDPNFIQEMAAEVQQSIIDVLLKKTLQAAKDYNAKTIILGGGVSANQELRKQFYSLLTTNYKLNLLVPPANLSTDNGLMIAVAGYFNRAKKIGWRRLSAHPNLRIGE